MNVRSRTLAYVVLGILQRSLNLLLLPLVTRLMSPAEYGLISVVVATTALIGVIFAFSIEPVLFRAVVSGGEPGERVIRRLRRYATFFLPFGAVALSAGLLMFGNRIGTLFVWSVEVAASGLTVSMVAYGLPILRAREQIGRYIAATMSSMTILVTSKSLILWLWLPGALGWALSDLIAAAVGWLGVVLFVPAPKDLPSGSGFPLPTSSKQLLKACLPLVPHRLSFWALTSMGRPLLAIGASSSEVGIFALAMNIALVATTLLMELNRAVLIEYTRETFPAPTARTLSIGRTQVLAALLVPAMVGVSASALGPVVLGSSFHAAIPLAGILLVGQVAYGLYELPTNYLVQAAGLFRYSSLPVICGATLAGLGVLAGGFSNSLNLSCIAVSFGFVMMTATAFWLIRLERLRVDWSTLMPRGIPSVLAAGSLGLGIASVISSGELIALLLALFSVVAGGLTVMAHLATRQARG